MTGTDADAEVMNILEENVFYYKYNNYICNKIGLLWKQRL